MDKRLAVSGVFTAALIIILAGCSSAPNRTDIARDEAKAQSVREDAYQAQMAKKQAHMEREMASMPDWVLNPPKATAQGFYGVGISSDPDMLTAMRKAKLQGTYEIAKAINAELSGEDTMTGSGRGDYRYVIDLFVKRVNVAGAELVQQEVKPMDGVYKSYVLLKLPMAEFNHAMNEQRAASKKVEIEDAYERLMKRLAAEPTAQEIPSPANKPNYAVITGKRELELPSLSTLDKEKPKDVPLPSFTNAGQ